MKYPSLKPSLTLSEPLFLVQVVWFTTNVNVYEMGFDPAKECNCFKGFCTEILKIFFEGF